MIKGHNEENNNFELLYLSEEYNTKKCITIIKKTSINMNNLCHKHFRNGKRNKKIKDILNGEEKNIAKCQHYLLNKEMDIEVYGY